jgi:hypothetical protein
MKESGGRRVNLFRLPQNLGALRSLEPAHAGDRGKTKAHSFLFGNQFWQRFNLQESTCGLIPRAEIQELYFPVNPVP